MLNHLINSEKMMNSDRKTDQADRGRRDQDETIERSMAVLLKENARLKTLVVRLSETVIRNVTRKK